MIRLIFSAAIPARARIDRSVHFAHGALGVVINGACVIEENVMVGAQVVLGGKAPIHGAPHVEAYAIIHTGAKIIGPIRVGRGAIVAANAVVTRDVPPRSVVAGIPARVIKTDIDTAVYFSESDQ